jgi:uncharacterized protein (DUF486 family)
VPAAAQTVVLLIMSNVFMTFAWYAHLKELGSRPWFVAAIVSWGVALFEYLCRCGESHRLHAVFTAAAVDHAEVITLAVFAPFSVIYFRQPLKLVLSLGRPLPVRRAYFMFRNYGTS